MSVLRVIVPAVAGFVAIAGYAVREGGSKPPHFVIIDDQSESVPEGCDAIAALAENIIASGIPTRNSKLALVVLGNETSDYEPQRTFERKIPMRKGVLDSRHKNQKKVDAFVRDLVNSCREARRTRSSPILQAIRRSIEHLTTLGCSEQRECFLFVQSDGLESADSLLAKALAHPVGKLVLPPPVRNDGIRVMFSGIAVTKGKGRKLKLREGRQTVWLKMFTAPNLVSFEPFRAAAEAR